MKIQLKTSEDIEDWNAAREACHRKWLDCTKLNGVDPTDRESWSAYESFPIALAVKGIGDMLATPFVVNEMSLEVQSVELSEKIRVLAKGGVWLDD